MTDQVLFHVYKRGNEPKVTQSTPEFVRADRPIAVTGCKELYTPHATQLTATQFTPNVRSSLRHSVELTPAAKHAVEVYNPVESYVKLTPLPIQTPDSGIGVYFSPLQHRVTPIKTPSPLGFSSPTFPFHLAHVDPLQTLAMGPITPMPIAGQGHYYTPSPTDAVDRDDAAVTGHT